MKNSGGAKRKKIDVVYSRSSNLRQGEFLSDVCAFLASHKKLPVSSAFPFHNQQQHILRASQDEFHIFDGIKRRRRDLQK